MLTAGFSQIAQMLQATIVQQHSNPQVSIPLTDSRKLLFAEQSIFFAISSGQKDANAFIVPLYQKGVRCFVSHHYTDNILRECPEANLLQVPIVLQALQQLAALHRNQFHYPVIGITGSNGKTIVKEWLYQLLQHNYTIFRSPKSYNSQVGVPLSVWQMGAQYNLAILEAGISQPGEMEQLRNMIKPDMGIFTFLGDAHNQGFESMEQKATEKLKLFTNASLLFYCSDEMLLYHLVQPFALEHQVSLFSWGKKGNPTLKILSLTTAEQHTTIQCHYASQEFEIKIPFTDEASIHNAITCCAVMLHMECSIDQIKAGLLHLKPVAMRLELKQGVANCAIINDSYSADIHSLTIALDFLQQQQEHSRRSLILSDMVETGLSEATLYKNIAAIVAQKNLYRFVGIGNSMVQYRELFKAIPHTHFFDSTESFLAQMHALNFKDETILLKGARIFKFEQISSLMEQKQHQTFLEINLNALRNNINAYKRLLKPGVKLMTMVKAFSYGSGSHQIASLLQHAGVDYLGVAYSDEGVVLRKAGINLPIMVMNTEAAGFHEIVKYRLEPELYSVGIFNAFKQYLNQQGIQDFPVHIKLDTGMHRLGFEPEQMPQLCSECKAAKEFKIVSFFSHLAASDDAAQDAFTHEQAGMLEHAAAALQQALGYSFLKHIANTSAIHRHPQWQMDMVRLGIGLYGVDENEKMRSQLQNVTTLKTTISQIKKIKAGQSIGYSRSAIAQQDIRIATVRIGYADGYPRLMSNGKGQMLVNGQLAPVVGRVCMDMTMIDITGIAANEEDEVIVFGEELPVTQLAQWAQTIPYEILTNISQRVKRLYFEE